MDNIKLAIAQQICTAFPGLDKEEIFSYLEKPADSAMGDLALPCFKLAKAMKKAPPAIAVEIAAGLGEIDNVASYQTVGGYLNFFMDKKYFSVVLDEICRNKNYGSSTVGEGKTVCIDFSSPNISKRFHIGHIGSTAIGNSIRNIYKFCGWNCVAINYLGDWGTQTGKMITAFRLWSSKEKVDQYGLAELDSLYVRFNKEEKENPEYADMARKAFADLENGDPECTELWKYFREISLADYMRIYKLLNIEFDSFNGESFFSDKIPGVVEELKEKNLLVTDDGAQIIPLEEYNMPPALILKRDGSTLYPARDIAAAIWRKKEYDFDRCIYVTDAGQSLHFAQWFKIVELMGREWANTLVHTPYGVFSINGEKIASRKGNVVRLEDLLTDSITRCERIIEEKNNSIQDKKQVAEKVGVGAIIFNTLANSRIKDVNFVWEDALSFEGNTGPYAQYTYARCASVLRKSEDVVALGSYTPVEEEVNLIKKLQEFPQQVLRAMEEYEPSIIAKYMLSCCTAYNQFYHNLSILKGEGGAKIFRLKLTDATKQVLGKCLDLLGMARTEEI